jgi:hypothetical protein
MDDDYPTETPASTFSKEFNSPEPRDPRLNEYVRLVSLVLMKFQWIEEFLKLYIVAAHQSIFIRTMGILNFKYDEKKIREMPMAPLINHFARLGGDPSIVASLKDLPAERNKIAHASFLINFDQSGQVHDFEKRFEELRALDERLKSLPFSVNSEYRALVQRLKAVNSPKV